MTRRLTLAGLVATGALLAGCATKPPPYNYAAFQKAKPASLLVLPPVNNAPDVKATPGVWAHATQPLAEAGYYILPVTLVDETLRGNGIQTANDAHAITTRRRRSRQFQVIQAGIGPASDANPWSVGPSRGQRPFETPMPPMPSYALTSVRVPTLAPMEHTAVRPLPRICACRGCSATRVSDSFSTPTRAALASRCMCMCAPAAVRPSCGLNHRFELPPVSASMPARCASWWKSHRAIGC